MSAPDPTGWPFPRPSGPVNAATEPEPEPEPQPQPEDEEEETE